MPYVNDNIIGGIVPELPSNPQPIDIQGDTLVISNGVKELESFQGLTDIKKVVIPPSVEKISADAFNGCTTLEEVHISDMSQWCKIKFENEYSNPLYYAKNLYLDDEIVTELDIPSGVAGIENFAFVNCASLTVLKLPNGVKIGNDAFRGCTAIKTIKFRGTLTEWRALGASIDSECRVVCTNGFSQNKPATPKQQPTPQKPSTQSVAPTKPQPKEPYVENGVLIIPDGTTEIKEDAFKDRTDFTSVTIPNSVTSIVEKAFYNCTGLTSITIPDSVTSIDYSAFENCTGLTSVTIGSGVTSIESSSFYGCKGLTSITVSSNNTKYHSQGNCLIETESKTLIFGCKNSIIPDDGSVTSIGDIAFCGCTGLTNITVPDSVTSIGSSAFYNTAWYNNQPDGVIYIGKVLCGYKGTMPYNTSIEIKEGTVSISSSAFFACSGLTSITIPDSVTSIGDCAFNICNGLTSITIPDSVTSIGNYAFNICNGLTGITVSPNNAKYHSQGNCLIETESKTLILGCKNSIIPDDGSVTSIGDIAFYACRGLKSITIPDSVTSIGDRAFYACRGLTSITIPDSVTSIGDRAFNICSGLTSITIPDSVTSIGDRAFNICNGLTGITVSPNNAKYHSQGNCLIETESKTLILGCKNSIIPDDGSVTSIGDIAFYACRGLKSITIPESVTSIGYEAFSYCTGLTSITIPDSVTSIGYEAFCGCTGLKSIMYRGTKEEWSKIEKGYNCDLHTGEYTVFYDCLPELDLGIVPKKPVAPKQQTATKSEPIQPPKQQTAPQKPSTQSVAPAKPQPKEPYVKNGTLIIPEGITEIKAHAFEERMDFSKVIIPDSVTSIGEYAFSYCTGLTSITIPDSVASIGDSAFSYCTGLTSITIPDSVASIGDSAFFSYCTGLTSITIPDSVASIGDSAFSYCTGLTSITIPDSVTSIGYKVFYGCTGLTSIKYRGTKKQWKAIEKNPDWKKYTKHFLKIECKDGNVHELG